MDNFKIPESPLNKIALTCSGGGYRAATFHLGAISYLNRLTFQGNPLLENVKMISTVSGGTITGVIYALMKQKGHTFMEIYYLILEKIQKTDLVRSGIEKLNPGAVWSNPNKRKNLINAFAEIYDQEFTDGATFHIFNKMNSHLEAVVFNSTEFTNGIDFRFRNKGTGYFGNNYFRVDELIADEVKLADVIASSSCFPGGFEPIVWPQDFVHDKALKLKDFAKSTDPVGIMDGGIYDNQGVDSILGYYKNRYEPYFDLVIISDVASPYVHSFIPATDQPKEGFRKYNLKELFRKLIRLNRYINLGLAGFTILFALIPVFFGYSDSWLTGLFIGLSGSCLVLFILKMALVIKARKGVKKMYDTLLKIIPHYFLERFSLLKIEELSFRRVETLIMDRINSLISMVSSIFLKIVRKLNYQRLYDDDLYEYRRISNLIKELTEKDYNNRQQRKLTDGSTNNPGMSNSILNGSYQEVVGPMIKAVAEEAAGFGTTLWFTEKEQLSGMLDKLIATGQFNICYNILEYLEKIIFTENNGYEKLDNAIKNDLNNLYEQSKADWLRFKGDPMFMVNGFNNK
jgi:predicted acylesterase/phospholipase RssA